MGSHEWLKHTEPLIRLSQTSFASEEHNTYWLMGTMSHFIEKLSDRCGSRLFVKATYKAFQTIQRYFSTSDDHKTPFCTFQWTCCSISETPVRPSAAIACIADGDNLYDDWILSLKFSYHVMFQEFYNVVFDYENYNCTVYNWQCITRFFSEEDNLASHTILNNRKISHFSTNIQ